MDYKKFCRFWICLLMIMIFGCSLLVVFVDPFFHYRKPLPFLFYRLGNQRSINDGIIKNFEYDAIITGTSMTENFKSSEFDQIFNVQSIKVPFSGGTYYELDSSVERGFLAGHKIKYVVRSLDGGHLIEKKNALRKDLGTYPTFLYDDSLVNDVQYWLNEGAVKYALWALYKGIRSSSGGITSFDEYSNWMKHYKFGKEYALGKNKKPRVVQKEQVLTDEDIRMLRDNVEQNVVRLARQHPETRFYYFFPPYSIVWWKDQYEEGNLDRYLQAKALAIREIVQCENIKLFSFSLMPDVITNFDNYKDSTHYGEWINSKMLHWFKDGVGQITKDNCEDFIHEERVFFENYDYRGIFDE